GTDPLRAFRARELLAPLEDRGSHASTLIAHTAADVRRVAVGGEHRAAEDPAVLLPDPCFLAPREVPEDVLRRDMPRSSVEQLLVAIDVLGDDRRIGLGKGADVHASTFSYTTFSASTCIPTDS